jgi:hypothetical protein
MTKYNVCPSIISIFLLIPLGISAQAESASLLSDDPCNAKWHIEPQSQTIVFIGTETHPTRIAFQLSELNGLQLSVDSDSSQFSIMSGLVTINGQWNGTGKNTLTFTAVGDSPSLLVNGKDLPAFKGRWAAISFNNKDRQLLLEFPGATYANLKYQTGPGSDNSNASKAPAPAPPSLDALRAQLAEAETRLETDKRNLLARLEKDADYQAAAKDVETAKQALQSANQDGDSEEITKAATKEMVAQTALDHLTEQSEAADPDFKAASSQLDDLRKELAANGPLDTRKSWKVTVVGKPVMDNAALRDQIRAQMETVRMLGPMETPPTYWPYRREHLTTSEQSTINAVNTRNAQRQTAQLKLEQLQKQYTDRENGRLITASLDDGTGASIYATGPAAGFADTMEIGGKYTVAGTASMMDGVLRINLSSAIPVDPNHN